MTDISDNLAQVRRRIAATESRYGRAAGTVRLLAVSKTWPDALLHRAADAGQGDFGESYVQEALAKMEALKGLPLRWHFIGPIQSNKTRDIARHFHWVHSVDRLKIARRLSAQRPPELPPLEVCIQVNISGEANKSGASAGETAALAEAVAQLPRLRLRGLMAIPAPTPDFGEQRAYFRQVRELQDALIARGHALDTLSMGMSGDLEAAIAEGATVVRVGTGVFGQRGLRTEC
ncbi:MAG: YggS family pyridoxal phosphate-dependent enzyme [Gammaproteobacteria bacterium]